MLTGALPPKGERPDDIKKVPPKGEAGEIRLPYESLDLRLQNHTTVSRRGFLTVYTVSLRKTRFFASAFFVKKCAGVGFDGVLPS